MKLEYFLYICSTLTVHELQGEAGLAIATLQRLGEDVEICLKQLLFGTVRRTLRMQIAEEMRRYGYLGSFEWDILERISLIEVCECLLILFFPFLVKVCINAVYFIS